MSEAKIRTKKRLEEIEQELDELRAQRSDLKGQWETEKLHIKTIRDLKSQIEEVKHEASEVERAGEYGRVAELRYGTLLELERQLEEANAQLIEMQKGATLLKEEVDAEDIAEIVGKWTGIPIQRMLESERDKLLHMEDRLHDRVVGQQEAIG